jgi:hypothetical protein
MEFRSHRTVTAVPDGVDPQAAPRIHPKVTAAGNGGDGMGKM